MKQHISLTKSEEQERANETLTRGICFISKVPFSDNPYELVFHAGAERFVFVDKKFLTTQENETTDVRISEDQSST